MSARVKNHWHPVRYHYWRGNSPKDCQLDPVLKGRSRSTLPTALDWGDQGMYSNKVSGLTNWFVVTQHEATQLVAAVVGNGGNA